MNKGVSGEDGEVRRTEKMNRVKNDFLEAEMTQLGKEMVIVTDGESRVQDNVEIPSRVFLSVLLTLSGIQGPYR